MIVIVPRILADTKLSHSILDPILDIGSMNPDPLLHPGDAGIMFGYADEWHGWGILGSLLCHLGLLTSRTGSFVVSGCLSR